MPDAALTPNPKNPFRQVIRDPVLLATLAVLWVLLILFILFPMVRLFLQTFEEAGSFTLANISKILGDPNQRQPLWNSLILATLVGLWGTALGFLFAFTAVRTNLSRGWNFFLDAAIILPLISPPSPRPSPSSFPSARGGSSPMSFWE